jgi:hypothetical protein
VAEILAPPAPMFSPRRGEGEGAADADGDGDGGLEDIEAMHEELGRLRELLVELVAERVGDECASGAADCAQQ